MSQVSSTKRLVSASAIMASGTLISRVLGVVRVALLAFILGNATRQADIYGLADMVPNSLYILFAGGALNTVLVPQIVRAMARADGGQDFTDRLLTLVFLVLGAMTVLALLATPWIVNALSDNKNPEFLSLATTFAFICMPQLFFYGLYAVLGQVLNARGEFSAYAWAPAWANIVNIVGLVYFVVVWGQQTDPTAWTSGMIWVLAGSTTLGIVVQGVGLLIPLRRTGFRYRPRVGWRGYGFGEVSRMAMWTMAALAVTQAVALVTTRALTSGTSRMAEVPGNAAQQYAYTLFILPHSLITISIVTALFPAMSRAVERADLVGLRSLVTQGLRTPAVLVIPATIAFIALGRPIVATVNPWLRYVPERGIDEVGDVALILAAMAIGVLPLGITALKQRYAFARVDGWFNLWTVSVMAAGNLLTAYLAMVHTPPEYVVAVIGLGASLSSTAAALCFILVARRQLDGLDLPQVVRLWVRLTLAAGLPAVLAWWLSAQIAAPGSPWARSLLALVVGGTVLSIGFLGLAKAMRIVELDRMLVPVISRARRLVGR